MMSNQSSPRGSCRLVASAVGLLGFVLAAQPAGAQPTNASDSSGVPPKGEVGSVVVHAPRQRPQVGIPPDKAKALDEQAAKDEAWRKYRNSVPPVNAGPLEQSKDYPGLHAAADQ
jgi:hypothetical protein